jgi:hypothetical protein
MPANMRGISLKTWCQSIVTIAMPVHPHCPQVEKLAVTANLQAGTAAYILVMASVTILTRAEGVAPFAKVAHRRPQACATR